MKTQCNWHWAAANVKKPDIIRTLIEAGAKLDARDEGGYTPLHWAAGDNKNP